MQEYNNQAFINKNPPTYYLHVTWQRFEYDVSALVAFENKFNRNIVVYGSVGHCYKRFARTGQYQNPLQKG